MKLGKTLCSAGVYALAALILGGTTVASGADPTDARDRLSAPAGSEGDFLPGEAIVRFEPGAPASERQRAKREAGASFESTLGLPRAQVVDVDGSVEAAVRKLERQPGVAYAQPNYRYEATAVEDPNDTFFNHLWGLGEPVGPAAGVYALEAWEDNKGAGQVIAILDTGVDLTHPDLEGNLWEGVLGEHGHDFVDGDTDPDDYNYHGTHVAGTAAAVADNNLGIAGAAPEAEIMAVRVLNGDGFGSTDEIAAGIAYAAEEGAGVINMSLGGQADEGPEDQAMSDAIAEAGEAGAVTVVAAGNEAANNDTEPHTPCALPNPTMICVAALNRNTGTLAGFSNYGEKTVDLAAPGTSILSAKTDYKSLLSDGFDHAELPGWEKFTESGIAWGGTNAAFSEGTHSAADSPGPGQKYEPESDTQLIKDISEPTNLTTEQGCRSHFDLRRDIQPIEGNKFTDVLAAGALTELSETQVLWGFAGSSGGQFRRTQISISDLDGQADVYPVFAFFSDDTDERDGAYIDDLELLCRDNVSYLDEIAPDPPGKYDKPSTGNYVRFQGTSMATPHVAGVVALVRAAAPSLSVQQAIDAVLDGTSAMPGLDPERPTATSGIADACKAIAVATEQKFEELCPASSVPEEPEPSEEEEDEPSSPDDSSDTGAPPPAVPPPPIAAPDLVAPHTFIRQRPRKRVFTPWRRGRAVFKFRSNEAGVLFFCQFDRKRWRRCGPRFVRWFLAGRHVLRVKARDVAGNVDPTPAVYRFRVRRVSKKQFVRLKRASRRARRDRR